MTREDVEKLKYSWFHDPCWDIEDTEGFEDYKEELKEYHLECKKFWDEKEAATPWIEKQKRRIEQATTYENDRAIVALLSEIALALWNLVDVQRNRSHNETK